VTVDPTVQISAGPDRTICPDASVTLSVTPVIAGTFTWSPATGLNTTSGASVIASPKVPTQYTVRANTTRGCTNETSVRLLIYAPPSLAFSNLPIEYTNRQVSFLNTTQGATSYLWDFGDGQSSSELSPTHRYAQAGTFSVKLTAFFGSGCQKELVQPITIRDVFIPNIITPDEDGKNDHFAPFVSTQPVTLKIYDRWGRLVFENANYAGGWGAPSTIPGVYYYHIQTKTGESWKGWLQVTR
jgi:gliding motility-associated-like protein